MDGRVRSYRVDMNSSLENVLATIEPLEDAIYGPKYRCSLTLKDGTFLPCAVLQSKTRLVELAKRRIKEEMGGKGRIGGPDPYGQIVETFVSGFNRVAEYNVLSAAESKYAIPRSLLSQIHGETTMAWTGWVFRMSDGHLFSYGSSFNMEFFQLPDGYEFSDVVEVVNHSFVNSSGSIVSLQRGTMLPSEHRPESVLRDRVFFICAVDGI